MTPQEPALRSRESATGAIYDLGYRGYDGPRLGRRYAVATLFWASLRAAYALKRSGRAKIVPWGLAALLVIPAGVSVAIAALAPGAPVPYTYDNYLWDTQVLLAIFVAAQAPELVSSDQRHRVLSLYFSHALERTDYALAKLGALAAAVFGMALVPLLVLFLGRVLLAQDVAEAFGNEIENLPQVVVAPVLYAIPLAGLSLAIAAFTPRRAYATGAIIAVFIVTAAVSAILGEAVENGPIGDLAQLINPFVPIDGTRDLLVGGPAPDSPVDATGFPLYWFAVEWVLLSVVTAGAVLWRYRRLAA
jgi:ABC-2 type transport system permease protein